MRRLANMCVAGLRLVQLNRVVVLPLRFLALIPIAVGINLAMGRIAQSLQLPVFLDTIGTVLVAALAGFAWIELRLRAQRRSGSPGQSLREPMAKPD